MFRLVGEKGLRHDGFRAANADDPIPDLAGIDE
jgi:hypothetical protein